MKFFKKNYPYCHEEDPKWSEKSKDDINWFDLYKRRTKCYHLTKENLNCFEADFIHREYLDDAELVLEKVGHFEDSFQIDALRQFVNSPENPTDDLTRKYYAKQVLRVKLQDVLRNRLEWLMDRLEKDDRQSCGSIHKRQDSRK